MRIVRVVGVLAAAVLAVTGLSACQSKVGAAAFVGSTRISESTVSKYVASTAKPQVSDQTGALDSPRSDVLGALIEDALFTRLLKSEPEGAPTAAQLDAAGVAVLAGSSYSSLAALQDAVVVGGYTRAYGALLLDQAAKQSIVTTRLKDPGRWLGRPAGAGQAEDPCDDESAVRGVGRGQPVGGCRPARVVVPQGPLVQQHRGT